MNNNIINAFHFEMGEWLRIREVEEAAAMAG